MTDSKKTGKKYGEEILQHWFSFVQCTSTIMYIVHIPIYPFSVCTVLAPWKWHWLYNFKWVFFSILIKLFNVGKHLVRSGTVASNAGRTRFEYSHRQFLIEHIFTINCFYKKEKEAANSPLKPIQHQLVLLCLLDVIIWAFMPWPLARQVMATFSMARRCNRSTTFPQWECK